MKKILRYNRRFLKQVEPIVYPIACVAGVICGAVSISDAQAEIPIVAKPLGYFLFYGGFIVLVSFTVELIGGAISGLWLSKKGFKKRNTLSERITLEEQRAAKQ